MPKAALPSQGERAMLRALAPFIGLSAAAATLVIALFAAAFLVPLAWAQSRGWTGAGQSVLAGVLVLALPALLVVYAASKQGVRRQLRPLAQVGAALRERLQAEPRVRGRLRKGWGAALEFSLDGDTVRAVAARGQRARPELYLVRGAREYRFRDVRDPLPELEEALRAVGL
jgi:hypothetical protein